MIPKWLATHLSAVILASGFVGLVTWRTLDIHHQRDIGVWQERTRVQDSLLQVQSHRIDSLKLTFHTDTVRLARIIRDYRTVHDTLNVVLHDTTVRRDTLIQVVERYRDRADSTIQECRQSLVRCVQLTSHQDSLARILVAQRTLWQASRPGVLQRSFAAAKWLGVGLAAGYVYGKH